MRALEWATAVWRTDGSTFSTFEAFLQQFREVFEHPTKKGKAGEQLLTLSQGKRSAAEYALLFLTLAAQTTWVEDTLKLLFRRGLTSELQSELACRDEGKSLSEFIDLAIQIDNLICSQHSTRATPRYPHETTTASEPMQLGFTHLTPEERERRMQNHLCLYCGQSGHMKTSCPVRPSSSSQSVSVQAKYTTSASSFKLPVQLIIQDKVITTTALLDSGAARNFISYEFASQCKLRLTPCNSPLAVEALDSRPLGEGKVLRLTEEVKLHIGTLHLETIQFYVIHSPNHSLILGLLWLRTHNPHISWREGQITQWDVTCQDRCLSKISRIHSNAPDFSVPVPDIVNLPPEYTDLAEAFSKKKAFQLPAHRSVDCAIDLMPGTTPPKGRISPCLDPIPKP